MQNKAVEIIRHSLAAAHAALDLLGSPQPVVASASVSEQSVVVEAAPVVKSVVEAAPVVESVVEAAPSVVAAEDVTKYDATDILENELENSNYKLRTLNELAICAGIRPIDVIPFLEAGGIEIVTKTRRADGAKLVGLASRN
jgi:hypothetical protein